ncbi:MAG: 30S ribosome-binding factor RbfA [Candidatus Azobacteroides pseudotrichonymphae]|jgi:ribosome-binding factor A|uniref:Ribosome-binding factor A n=1 Tax=Azobacteroides pseudotrichonymphae genomovar. CFP2 TaxID=511995 RepID=B6YQT6_AZOPC|nr:30S ribosome-binding factor RbfA [Candidatus Azobacteroides pseudotrichonymphae]BAG83558.1 ribosome-binding factor A [Candidatus Azobacteroides pseudotrichonymphae genomovar. CFP2]GMO32636.1 MAG: 30S ribosome-binding factor RbfA [Candidatus Azobacteroides pseudotrichonymphae]
MGKRKLQKIERLVQKEINELFRLQTQQMRQLTIISVTTVRISSDLSVAKIFLSIYPSDKIGKITQSIEQGKSAIRYNLGLRIGKQIRHIPKLAFFVDNSFEYVENINHLLGFNGGI